MNAYFVTGTDTNVGKTVACALLCKVLNAGYWKPIQSGTVDGKDADTVRELTGLPATHFYSESYCLREPLSPHAAAEIDGIQIDLNRVSLPRFTQRALIVEGAGGLLVPVNEREYMIDLIGALRLPAILVSRSTLGTINHTLLSLRSLRSAGVPVLGVIVNGPHNPGNVKAIKKYGDVEILAEIDQLNSLTADSITQLAEKFRNDLFKRIPDLASLHANEDSRHSIAGAQSLW